MRPTDRRFTGQRWEASLGLYDYRARFYDPALGRFLQPDPLVPEPGNPQALNRYAYVYHNPLRSIDGDGHLPVVPLLVAGAILALKVVDYGWTAYEAWHSLRVMNDPHASPEARAEAAANLALTAAFEAGEPEELLPISLPLDDLARVGLIGGVKRVGKEAGEEAAERAGKEVAGESTQRLIRHHIATNKNWIRDPQWSRKFQELFAQGGMTLEDVANIMELPAELHKGPHPQAYHQWVFERLQGAIAGLDDPMKIRARLEAELRAIAEELKAHPEWLRNPPGQGGR